MSKERKKALKLLAFWLFGTVVIVFAAITAYITIIAGGNVGTAVSQSWPIWGITALAAIIIFVGYYLYAQRKG